MVALPPREVRSSRRPRICLRARTLAAAFVLCMAGTLSSAAPFPTAEPGPAVPTPAIDIEPAVASSATVPEPASASPEAKLADGLLKTIPSGTGVALRPLDPVLPDAVRRRLYDSVLGALVERAAERGVTVLARERLGAVYESLAEFDQGTIEGLLKAAKADVEIICDASPVTGGVTLSCAAIDLLDAVNVAHAVARFTLESPAALLDIAVVGVAARLVERAQSAGSVGRVMLLESATGARSDLGLFLAERLRGELGRRMAERMQREENEARTAAVLQTAPEKRAPHRYRVHGTLWRLDGERLRLEARLLHEGQSRTAAGGGVAAGADIALASLPPELAGGGVRPSGPSGTGRTWEALAEAVVSARLDRRAARRAARNLARARVVAQALGLPPPRVTEVRTEADAVAPFEGFLDAGLPVDERFFRAVPEGAAGDAEERVAVRLVARVEPVGVAPDRPVLSARLGRTVFRAMEPISLEIRSEEAVHLGVFAWGADNRVVRLYPRGGSRLSARAGESLFLPRPGEGRILSVPMPEPGNREDHETLIVVAVSASSPLDFTALAPEVGASLDETLKRAVDGSRFFAALAAQNPARMTLRWLPYQVHR